MSTITPTMKLFSSQYKEFTDHYENFKNKIWSFVFYRVGQDQLLAEDITSDIFLKAFDKYNDYNPEFAFSTWIYSIARNTIIDHYRKNQSTVEWDDQKHDTEIEESFSKDTDQEINAAQIQTALQKIPEKNRDIVIMKYLEDMDTSEIAEITNQSPANIRQILSRSLKSLKAHLPETLFLLFLLSTPI